MQSAHRHHRSITQGPMTIVHRQVALLRNKCNHLVHQPNRFMNRQQPHHRMQSSTPPPPSQWPWRKRSWWIIVTVMGMVTLSFITTIVYHWNEWSYPLSSWMMNQPPSKPILSSEEEIEINRCHDTTDSDAWRYIPHKQNCLCPDPLVSTKELRKDQPEWMEHHHTMVNDVIYETSIAPHTVPLDIVFLGDSITERWNGTRSMGTRTNFPEFRESFNAMFDRRRQNSNAKLQGLLFGSSGDITTELLWHMQNGLLNKKEHPHRLEPKVFMILIGTNDLGRMECSKTTTIMGITNVLSFISWLYPHTPVLVHGLLPRSDTYNKGDYYLGRYWQDIMYINEELEQLCQKRRGQLWHYMDASQIFLSNYTFVNKGMNISGQSINETVMSDSLHPDVLGYNIWGQLIVEKVLQIISDHEKKRER